MFQDKLNVCTPKQSCECNHVILSFSQQKDLLIMYGGEWFDGATDKTYVYGDLYLYDTGKDRWKKIDAPSG